MNNMKFNTVQEAFNHYRNHSLVEIEQRAAQLRGVIEQDANADIAAINIEIEGLQQAKANAADKQGQVGTAGTEEHRSYNPILGQSFNQQAPKVNEDIFGTVEYRNAFYKSLLGQQLSPIEQRTFENAMQMQETERRTDAFNTTTDAAAVLPTTTLNEVIKKARTMGGLMAHVRSFNIPTKIAIPIGTPSTKASWHTEGDEVETEKASVAKVSFDGYELIKIFSISAAAKKMSISAFEAYITDELTNCVMEAIADALVNGTGVGQGTGLDAGITWDSTNTVEAATELKYTDLTKALALIKRGYAAGAKVAMNNATLYNHVYNVLDGNGRPIFVADTNKSDVGYVLGKEVVIDDNIADDTIIIGNFKYMAYNMPQGLLIEASRESSFKKGLVDYRALAIADTKPLVTEAFVKVEVTA